MNTYNYVALGDSYTIGEQVNLHESFPYQVVSMLRREGFQFQAPEIVAKTGWTTGELIAHLDGRALLRKYNLVTLLIGVNNQYRGLSQAEYASEFRQLLSFALDHAATKESVIVLSIPDWGLSPFAGSRDVQKIKSEINDFNGVNASIAEELGITYIDITTGLRQQASIESAFAQDRLHPSALEYNRWAKLICKQVKKIL